MVICGGRGGKFPEVGGNVLHSRTTDDRGLASPDPGGWQRPQSKKSDETFQSTSNINICRLTLAAKAGPGNGPGLRARISSASYISAG